MTDLDIIKQIENELDIKLKPITKPNWIIPCCVLNKHDRVVDLCLYGSNICNLNRINSQLEKLDNLRRLNLEKNKIVDISPIKRLIGLKRLDIEGNQIFDISPIKGLLHLNELYLSHNKIKNILEIKYLISLEKLSLASNQIIDISPISILKNLSTLDLDHNQIIQIFAVANLLKLTRLNLSLNRINDISPIKELTGLERLDLDHNQISDVSVLENLINLTRLDLDCNQIDNIWSLNRLNKLKRLDLSSNLITDISPISKLHNLKRLSLYHNPIKNLYPWIIDFNMDIQWDRYGRNNYITFYDNPLKSIPVEIIKQGKNGVRDYFKSLDGKKRVILNEVKVLLVGEGMAGKTSLLKRLQGLKFNKNESQTHGVNKQTLHSKDIPGFKNVDGASNCKLHFWDFGGQEIMHASHQFFLSQRSLYILMLDSRTDSKRQYWLKHIEKHGGDSPIIVALNKVDENPGYNVEQNQINTEFPQIKNRFHRISCKTREGLSLLFKTIAQSIPDTRLFGSEISTDWIKIKDVLVKETSEKRYISRERFVKICEINGVKDKSSQQTLLQFLNDLGVVLYFKQLNLIDIYVLDPHWVTIGVYRIINSAKIVNGILRA